MLKIIISTTILFFLVVTGFSQNKNAITVAFYNCENFFDTKNDPDKNDEDFLPDAPSKWDETKYNNKIQIYIISIGIYYI